jgi:molybdopterin-dependent oxidoreductase alpha subunit
MAFNPSLWVSPAPLGLGQTKPGHFRAIARAAWENRDRLGYAWRILSRGVCDGCALGTTGLKDWTLHDTHLCMVRLELLRLNTMPPFDPAAVADASRLAGRSGQELRRLGRLPVPLLRRRGEPGFRSISWEEAIDLAAERLRTTDPGRVAFYLTSRGLPNETYYVAQKAARFLGTPHIDNSARLCHAASTAAMKGMLGHGASTGSYRDWLGADLIVFFGSNTPNNQPVATKFLYYARQRGAQVAVVNPYREPGLERYWVPSVFESALFGTRLADHWFEVDTGGDLAFLNGTLKALLALPDGIDGEFLARSTVGFEAVEAELAGESWEFLEAASGCSRERMEAFARLLLARPNAVLVWSMGLTQHAHGVETIRALVNLGLARGLVGRPHRGLTPIRGHSGVQGGAEVGAVPVSEPAVLDHWARVWGFEPPRGPGLSATEQLAAAAQGRIAVFWLVGGNFLDTVPDEERSRAALARPGLRVHQDIVLNSSMLVEPSDAVLLLPATTRYEIPGGVTETTTERRIVFSPEIPGPRVPGARPEWEVLSEVAARARPVGARSIRFAHPAAIRQEIARAVPLYAGIELLEQAGDQVQWGGPTLFADGRFATADGKAHFAPARPPERPATVGGTTFLLSTRRGKQFNSMVHAARDPLTGAGRDAVLMSEADARALGLAAGEAVRLASAHGSFEGRVHLAPIKPGNLEVHWPEGMALLSPEGIDPFSKEPDYNARVTVAQGPEGTSPQAQRREAK